jgi:hypothetical protein
MDRPGAGDTLDRMAREFATFDEFWLHYVRQHKHPANRALHVAGTLLAVGIAGLAIAKKKPWLLLLAPVAGYGLSFSGHFIFEKNWPVTFSHPIDALRADFVMVAKMLTGRMQQEIVRATATNGAAHPSAEGSPS